jgi:hypothetical protein
MPRFPVAGQIVGFRVFFGISLRDALETIIVPGALILFGGRIFPNYGVLVVAVGIVTFVAGAIILFLKHDNVRPHEYVQAWLQYGLTANNHRKRRSPREHPVADDQEVLVSQMESPEGVRSHAEQWRKDYAE